MKGISLSGEREKSVKTFLDYWYCKKSSPQSSVQETRIFQS